MKRVIDIYFLSFLLCSVVVFAQEKKESSIYCAEFDVTVNGYEVFNPSIIRICCGGIFEEKCIPCKVISKTSYESFSGQSNEEFVSIKEGIVVSDLIILKKDKPIKVKEIEIVYSSETILENNTKLAIKKGSYPISSEGIIQLEVEYLTE